MRSWTAIGGLVATSTSHYPGLARETDPSLWSAQVDRRTRKHERHEMQEKD
jgi:hypothetical protein